MKKLKISIICLMLINLIICGISLIFMGDIIPTHFGVTGEPDQYGSKYFVLIFPAIGILLGAIILLINKSERFTDNYKKYLLITGVIIQSMFVGLLILFMIIALTYAEGEKNIDVSKFMMLLLGTMLIILGNYMPKIEKNRTLGLKTKWSMYNETTWQKSHRFTGFASTIAGVLVLVSGLFFKDMVNFIILMSLVLLMVTTSTVASYIYYKEEKLKELENK